MTTLGVTAPDAAVPADPERLAELEAIVESGLDAYVRVGRALEAIRTKRLCLLTHRTFRRYLADRWSLSLRQSAARGRSPSPGFAAPIRLAVLISSRR
jgi:hypothetical protein